MPLVICFTVSVSEASPQPDPLLGLLGKNFTFYRSTNTNTIILILIQKLPINTFKDINNIKVSASIFNPGLAGQKKPCDRSDRDCDDYYDDDDDCCTCDGYDRVLQVIEERKGGKKCNR